MKSKRKDVPGRLPVAIDYLRFSGVRQELGDSRRRQRGLSDAWSERTGVPIDLSLADEGVSGLKGLNHSDPERYALAQFLELIEQGRVLPGDYLLLENFDRLSREEEVPATHLLTSILMAGVRVVQLAPHELEMTAKSDMFAIFRAVMELGRGHGESERKHQTVSAAYAANREAAAAGQVNYHGCIPAWIRRLGAGKPASARPLALDDQKAVAVKYIFRLASEGLGYTAITRRLQAEQVPPFCARTPRLDPETGEPLRGRGGRVRYQMEGVKYGNGIWTRPYVVSIIRGREAVGELTTKTGQILPIPAAITEDEWLAAQAGRAERNKHRGRSREKGPVNLFQGMLTDALTGDSYFAITRQGRGRQWRVIVNSGAKDGGKTGVSFPEPTFEAGILAALEEVDSESVVTPGGPDQVELLGGRIAVLQGRIAEQEAEIRANGAAPKAVLRVLAGWEEEVERLEQEQREARQAAIHPISDSWQQGKSLLRCVETPENRLRLRSILRRIVESIHVLIVPRGWDRLAAVQMRFKESPDPRSFLIHHGKARVSRSKRETGVDRWSVRTLREAVGLDLRCPADSEALRQALEAMDLATLGETEAG